MQNEIVTPGPLLDSRGRLAQVGWARHPLLDANLEARRGIRKALRVKRWDYYGVWTPELFVSATLSDLGYAGVAFVYAVDLEGARHVEHTQTRLFARGIHLPPSSTKGDAAYDDGRARYYFRLVNGSRVLHVSVPDFDGGRGLLVNLALTCEPAHESIVMATPLQGDCFYYNRKIGGLPANGVVVWGDRTVRASPTSALGQLDWGRGIWPYWTRWLWASASGFLPSGRILGINLGGGFGERWQITENALFVDGRLHKLGEVRIEPGAMDGRRPWRFTDEEGRLALEMEPRVERVARTNLGFVSSEVHQFFGRYEGRVVTDDGEVIPVAGLAGFAEEHRARW